MLEGLFEKVKKYQFMFEELVKRDFKQKYKRTALGMAWSILSPLLSLFVMSVVFSHFFGSNMEHYTIYLFCGNLVFNYFHESTMGGMNALMANADIFSKVNVPKYLFVISKNVSALINFGLTLCIFFLFVVMDGVPFHASFLMLLYPILCLVAFNVGIGLVLSALFVFFRDVGYLYDVFTMLLTYMSAIFYTVDILPPVLQNLFLLNPVYCYIRYFRTVVLEGTIPSAGFHLLCAFCAVAAVCVGMLIYKKNNHKFLYYV